MKIFWSWQSDTPGKVGRHFVRDALRLTIEALKQAPDVEEPTAAETRESIQGLRAYIEHACAQRHRGDRAKPCR
jgi:hypothetical protein